jgi:predicted dehydrogenase
MTTTAPVRSSDRGQASGRPRIGFVGTGWIGTHRMRSLSEAGLCEIACIADVSIDAACRARDSLGSKGAETRTLSSFDALLEESLDGIVIATPSSLHSDQTMRALNRKFAVFCQKPLARTASEAALVVDTARRNNRLLGVDLSYRHIRGVDQMKDLVVTGSLGDIYAADLTFHNAYGPDKAWFYDPLLSGGGCVMDLGTHLIDLLLHVLDHPEVESVSSRLYAQGQELPVRSERVEDFALAQLTLNGGATVRLACSWKLNAGCDAVIEATFMGTRGAVRLRNVNGSFYDFTVEHLVGTSSRFLASPPDEWGGRAAIQWARTLARSTAFDPAAHELVHVSRIVDRIYGR